MLLLALALLACSADDAVAGGEPDDRSSPRAMQAPVRTASAGDRTRLTPDMAEPYFRDGALGEAAERFALEDWDGARKRFAAHLAGARPDRATRARVHLLMALADAGARDWKSAARGFERAIVELPLLADYLHYHAARAHYYARAPDAALRHARQVAADSIVGPEAELLVGDLLRGAGTWQDMADHYTAYLRDRPRGMRRAEARYRLAQALDELGKTVPDALDHYRAVAIATPLSVWGKRSQERLDTVVPALPRKQRRRYQTLAADELIERGMVYYQAMRNPLSEADFARALSAPGLTRAARCTAAYHRANSVFKARDRKRAAPLFDRAIAACKKARNVDLHVKAAYQAGRSYAFIGERRVAIDRYRKAERVSRAHSYVDDARLRQAEEYAELGQDDRVRALLASIPRVYPDGDMRAEATWRLGWRAYSSGDYPEAIRWFRKQIEVKPIDDNWWAEGQAQYWMGRALAHMGERDRAAAAYREAVVLYPLSYYALLALERLRAGHPDAFEAVVREIRAPPADDPGRTAPLTFKPRPEYASPGFARALEFLRLGLGEPATAELRKLGLSVPGGKSRVTDPDRIDKIWAAAFLYHRAGRFSQSHWPTRWHVVDYKRTWPVAGNLDRWLIAYPRGYWDLLTRHADQHGFPLEILVGIVREESAFNPILESYANAIGLTQMIFPTARRFGRGTGIDITRANLRDPDKNVTIGSRFLAFLWDKWKGQVMLVPPSYNAGEGAVTRWLRERGTLPADEFIESIAADQARRYSKRVLSSYFAYSYLYGGQIPQISFTIADDILPAGARDGKTGKAEKKPRPAPRRGEKRAGKRRGKPKKRR